MNGVHCPVTEVSCPAGVLGIDGCRGAWVGIVLAEDGRVDAVHARLVTDLVARALTLSRGGLSVVGIDIPIGLPDTGRRRADSLARGLLGPRASSIFPVPVRAAVEEPDHTTASARNIELAGTGISRQSHGLRTAILDVDGWLRAGGRRPFVVVEVHPELSFATLAGGPLAHGKKTWSGMELRRRLLVDAGIELSDSLGEAVGRAAPDDVLDAAVVAWTARRVAAGTAVSYPDPPERFGDGLDAAIRA